jgi:hypothetical protein
MATDATVLISIPRVLIPNLIATQVFCESDSFHVHALTKLFHLHVKHRLRVKGPPVFVGAPRAFHCELQDDILVWIDAKYFFGVTATDVLDFRPGRSPFELCLPCFAPFV